MGKRLTERLENDYFTEPNYDRMTYEELDEMYNFGTLRSTPKRRKVGNKIAKKVAKKMTSRNLFQHDENDCIDLDFDSDNYYNDE